jgi:hypothetical protein
VAAAVLFLAATGIYALFRPVPIDPVRIEGTQPVRSEPKSETGTAEGGVPVAEAPMASWRKLEDVASLSGFVGADLYDPAGRRFGELQGVVTDRQGDAAVVVKTEIGTTVMVEPKTVAVQWKSGAVTTVDRIVTTSTTQMYVVKKNDAVVRATLVGGSP